MPLNDCSVCRSRLAWITAIAIHSLVLVCPPKATAQQETGVVASGEPNSHSELRQVGAESPVASSAFPRKDARLEDDAQSPFGSADWLASIDGLFIVRDAEDFTLAGVASGYPMVPIRLEHGAEPSLRAAIAARVGPVGAIEFRMLNAPEWSAESRIDEVRAGDGLPDQIGASHRFEAFLRSYELNWLSLHAGPRFEAVVAAGIRVVKQGDAFQSLFQESGGSFKEAVTAYADNQMVGAHLTLGSRYARQRLAWSYRVGAALLHNDATQSGPSYTSGLQIDGVNGPTFFERDTFASLQADLDTTLEYHLTENIIGRFGYHGIFFSDVVQAASQNGRATEAEEIAFHGIYLGILARL